MVTSAKDTLKQTILERVGLFDSVTQSNESIRRVLADVHLTSVLNRDNPRLKELEFLYRQFGSPALRHSQWSEELTSKITLPAFRGESAYVWQVHDGNTPVSYVATYYYLKQSSARELLERSHEDLAFAAIGMEVDGSAITRDRLDSVCELEFLKRALNLSTTSELTILDIGAGYGRLAWRFYQCFPKVRVLCADAVAESSFLCEFYLHFRGVPSANARMISLPELERTLSTEQVDLALAVNSLSECSARSVAWWLEILGKYNINRLFVVPHAAFEGGRRMYSVERSSQERKDIAAMIESSGFRRLIMAPKYDESLLQTYGVSPTYYHLYRRD